MDLPAYPSASIDKAPGLMDRLVQQSQRLHEEIQVLDQKLVAVRTQGPEVSGLSQPQEAPANRLHEAILTIEHANLRLRQIASELNL